mmetsp:Transcript_5257/g.12233  ORF Transcript_5257/g.12233 Transcript_5257/m.12233 type:complete len:583 (+) Transcript_5257:324-2072(+)
MGIVPPDSNGEGGTVYASVRNSRSIMSRQKITREGIFDVKAAMDDDVYSVEIVSHNKLLELCGEIRTVRFTTLPYQGASEAINGILDDSENEEKDIVLDIDLDGFSTTSPGALSILQTAIHDEEVLTRIFHTVHGDEVCDFDAAYWNRLIEMGKTKTNNSNPISNDDNGEACQNYDLSYVHGEPFTTSIDDDGDFLADPIVTDRAKSIVKDLDSYYKMNEEMIVALSRVVEYYLPVIDGHIYDDEKFIEMMDGFLNQPFYVPDQGTVRLVIDYHFGVVFRGIFGDTNSHGGLRRVPKVVNIIRSPFYTPDDHLSFIECEVFDRLLEFFGRGTEPLLYHSDEVDPDRTNCLHQDNLFPPKYRSSIGENPHIETDQWTETHNTYSSFYEDDDVEFGTWYKFDSITVDFVNEHKETLLVMIDKYTVLRVSPGEQITEKTNHLSKWEISFENDFSATTFKLSKNTVFFNGKHGERQTYGSITGWIPIYHLTPVKMEVTNPSDSDIDVELRSIDLYNSEQQHQGIVTISPGEVQTLLTLHGQRWLIRDASTPNKSEHLGEFIANATYGKTHSILLFAGDGGTSGNEL